MLYNDVQWWSAWSGRSLYMFSGNTHMSGARIHVKYKRGKYTYEISVTAVFYENRDNWINKRISLTNSSIIWCRSYFTERNNQFTMSDRNKKESQTKGCLRFRICLQKLKYSVFFLQKMPKSREFDLDEKQRKRSKSN